MHRVQAAFIAGKPAWKTFAGGLALTVAANQFFASASAPQPHAKAEPRRLEAHVRHLVALSPRDCDHLQALDQAAAYIRKELQAQGGRVSEQVFYTEEWNQKNQKVRRGPYRNVLALFGPDTLERVVIGAHYDAAGPFPGADDNASGVAGLLELARLLKEKPPALQTELAAYTLEEPPYFGTDEMGSAIHAKSLAEAGVKVRAMISLEMLGYFSDQNGSQQYPVPLMKLFYPSRGDFIAVVGRFQDRRLINRVRNAMRATPGLSVESLKSPASLPGVDFSDHRNYWKRGYPAVMVTDTSFYRNPHYHTPGDVPETLDYKRMALVVDGVYRSLQDLSQTPVKTSKKLTSGKDR